MNKIRRAHLFAIRKVHAWDRNNQAYVAARALYRLAPGSRLKPYRDGTPERWEP